MLKASGNLLRTSSLVFIIYAEYISPQIATFYAKLAHLDFYIYIYISRI